MKDPLARADARRRLLAAHADARLKAGQALVFSALVGLLPAPLAVWWVSGALTAVWTLLVVLVAYGLALVTGWVLGQVAALEDGLEDLDVHDRQAEEIEAAVKAHVQKDLALVEIISATDQAAAFPDVKVRSAAVAGLRTTIAGTVLDDAAFEKAYGISPYPPGLRRPRWTN